MPHFVKKFDINGVKTKQVACIELHGAPNAATKGAVGVLGIDVDSPAHEVYKCVAVNGAIYTWQLLSGGESVAPVPKTIDLSALDINGTIVEEYPDGTRRITTMEFDDDGNPVKITDGDGNVTELTW